MNCRNVTSCAAIARSCALAAGLAIVGSGCRTASTFEHATGATMPPPASDILLLEAGDEIDVKFYYAPELNITGQTIRPDGKISLQLVGEVQVAGQTPGSLEKSLKDKYHGLIDKNEVTVMARKFSNRVVFVGGAVQRPQAVPMAGQMTALAAILSAGGEDAMTAAMNEVVVLRLEGGKYRGFALDLARTLTGQDSAPFYLLAGDIVYVSRTRISDLNRWVDQHINRMVPGVGITALHTAGNSVFGVQMSQ